MKCKLEYIWLSGERPEPNIRSKTKIWDFEALKNPALQIKREMSINGRLIPCPEELPEWSFDGSSTQQAKGDKSDCILKPVRVVYDPARLDAFLVMCEVMNSDGTPHETNTRHGLSEDKQYWFGFEQEYVLSKNGRPLGFPTDGYPKPQGDFYCGVGTDNVDGRDIAEEHLQLCLEAGLNITGINAEVMLGQWEYQLLSESPTKSSDDLWLSRYLLYRVSERYGLKVDLHPKPILGDWNGSGCHINFSSDLLREVGGQELLDSLCNTFHERHKIHIENYGSFNELRLTGEHETQSINEFSVGVGDRGASIRIPVEFKKSLMGYLEDRRPSSNVDPYRATRVITEAIEIAEKDHTLVIV
jgi:glutamine synthetase|tara:strand:- start:1714 stop:2787 length:1074 start_codon:yes stop_codon:yes gene_type:complete